MKGYIYLSREEDDEEPEEIEVNAFSLISDDMLDGEISNVGLPEEWAEELKKFPSGYYEITFDYHFTSEGWECPHQYPVLDGLEDVKKSWKAFWLGMLLFYIRPAVWQIESLFLKCWRIEYLYGGAGVASPDMYLPVALWYRIFNVKKFAYWGEGFEPSLTKR